MELEGKEEKIYYEELEDRAKKLSGMDEEIALLLVKLMKNDYPKSLKYTIKIKTIMSEGIKPICDSVKKLLGKYLGDLFEYIVNHKTEYPYSTGYYRRPFRSSNIENHLEGILDKLEDIFEIDRCQFSIMKYLTISDYTMYNGTISYMIAFEIDRNNQEVIDALKEVIYGDNNTALLSSNMIKGIFLSHSMDQYKIMGDLLIAAKLQEGLRQNIVERMDEGTLEAYLYMLKIIVDNNFIRYSSIVRALGVWTGMDFEAINTRVTKQCIEYAYNCLSDEHVSEEYFNSSDANKLYMSLWAAAVREEENVYSRICAIMENGEDYQKITAQYFLAQSQNSELRFRISQKYLEQPSTEIQYWAIYNYDKGYSHSREMDETTGEYKTHVEIDEDEESLQDKSQRVKQFYILKNILLKMPKKEIMFTSKVFDWLNITYSTDLIVKRMMYLTAYDMDSEFVKQLIDMKDLVSPDIRKDLLEFFINGNSDKLQRNFIFECLSDKSVTNREKALEKITNMELTTEEIEKLEAILKLKTGALRQNAIKILLNLDREKLEHSIERLLKSKDELQRLSALELISEIKNQKVDSDDKTDKKDNAQYTVDQFERLKDKISYIEIATEKEKVLIEKLQGKEEYNKSNVFGLLERTEVNNLEEPKFYKEYSLNEFFKAVSMDKIEIFLNGLSDLIHEHREYEYEVIWYDGYKQTHLIGEELQPSRGQEYDEDDEQDNGNEENDTDKADEIDNNEKQDKKDVTNQKLIDRYPMAEVWTQYLEKSDIGINELTVMEFCYDVGILYEYYFDRLERWRKDEYKELKSSRKTFITQVYPMSKIREIRRCQSKLKYWSQVRNIIGAYFVDSDEKERFNVCAKILNTLLYLVLKDEESDEISDKDKGKEKNKHKDQNRDQDKARNESKEKAKFMELIEKPWLEYIKNCVFDDTSFSEYFSVAYKLYAEKNYESNELNLEEFVRAYKLKLIDQNEIIKELTVRGESQYYIRQLTDTRADIISKYPFMNEFKDKIIKRILDIELKRGDLQTDVTKLTMSIEHFEGMEYFIKILLNLEKETFVRGYIYGYYNDNVTKKESFSKLLKNCFPKVGEDENLLKKMLSGKKISDKRLLEAAMYAPQWLDIVDKYLKWEGLRSAAWYFHAHVNETFSAEKETIVAHYSPITPAEFNDGAFDTRWFREAYEKLGKTRFNVLYDCAKYISGGSNHRRSQLFADATLGKLDIKELKKSAEEKRNRDHLLCITLLPIEKENKKDVLKRYEFVQKFLKESKKFGAQRRASEAKTVSIALDNLARNAGYSDVIRLTWDMESEKIKDILQYLEPKKIDDIDVQLSIDEYGNSTIKVFKGDKQLKSMPAKYNKQEYVIKLKEVKSELRDQYRRAKAELERSMGSEDAFNLEEITTLSENPVIAPIIKSLVLKTGKHIGYFNNGKLEGVGGAGYTIKENDEILIAHPVHLFESGKWSEYQKDIFERKIKQPFKQVFRELYILNEDELASGTVSRRYAGHQIQPRKATALLKSRLWTVSYEEGLQRVYYKENIIARIYALADWFSPSDVESPTIEWVEFFDRRTYKSIPIKKIPKIIFSEVMRDVDLVVSVAHVGGVDPEASLSTIDMRKAIVKESLRLMKIENVRVEGNYAHIKGTLGEYSVHLGSAMAYKQASGSLYIIPVHSQHRGRIFLPFLDEDPKTAEILSKIIMLSQDTKIKDPSILDQIR